MPLDNAKNFARATVSTGYNASATSIVLTTGHGARLPNAPFNGTWWNSTDYLVPDDDPNVELVRVTAKATDTLTITRAQEGTTASTKNTAGKTYTLLAGLTAKVINQDVVSRSGDTLTGPLTLAAPPTAALHATNKAYVDAIATGQLAGVYLISSFNASGSAATTTGTISSGSNQLTVASAATFAVNQGIYIAGAGAGGANLITRITAIAGTTFTLATTASANVSNVKVQHDDTVAIQTALNTLENVHSLTLIFDNGYYRVNGPINPTTNSILTVPFLTLMWGGTPRVLRMFGQTTLVADVVWHPSNQGTIIQTDVTSPDTNSSIINAGAPYLGNSFAEMFGAMYLVTVHIKDMCFRTYVSPQISGIDMWMTWNTFLENVIVDVGYWSQNVPTAPPPGYFGIRLPRNTTVTITNNVSVTCFGIGIIYSDLWQSYSSFVQRCLVGMYTRGHDYPINGTLLIVQCPTGIEIEGSIGFGQPGMDCHVRWENSDVYTTVWWAQIPNRYIYDPTNVLFGICKYFVVHLVEGRGVPITVTGCTALTKTNLKP